MPETAVNSEEMYQTLKNEILSLQIKPGQPLTESELCERFGVSRTPVRAVLQRLRDRRLVVTQPYKGTYASLLHLEEIRQIIYLRVAVESAVLRDFIAVATPTQMEKVRYYIRKQVVLLQGEYTPEQFYALDSQMHAYWFSATQKQLLWRTIQRAETHYTRFRMLDIVASNSFARIVAEHEKLLAILEARQTQEVEGFVHSHLYGGLERLEGRIQTDFADYFAEENL